MQYHVGMSSTRTLEPATAATVEPHPCWRHQIPKLSASAMSSLQAAKDDEGTADWMIDDDCKQRNLLSRLFLLHRALLGLPVHINIYKARVQQQRKNVLVEYTACDMVPCRNSCICRLSLLSLRLEGMLPPSAFLTLSVENKLCTRAYQNTHLKASTAEV